MNAPNVASEADLNFARIQAQFQPAFSASSPRVPVLYLNHSAQISGAEASLRTLLWGLRHLELPFDPTIALPAGGPFFDLLRHDGWPVVPAPLRRIHRPHGVVDSTKTLLHVVRAVPFVRRLIEQSGAKIVHSNSTTAHLIGGLAAQQTQRPALWHCRDLVPLGRLAAPLAHRAVRVVAISRCVAQFLEQEGVPPQKIAVVYNGIDPEEWRPRTYSLLRQSLQLPSDAFLFGSAGQLVPWKNHGAFIEAAAQLLQDESCGNAYFVLIGGDLWDDNAPYASELRSAVEKHGLGARFRFIAHQSDAVDALSAFDALVHPARTEPFGRVLLEMMALGKPVVAMNENGPREIITHERDGLLVAPLEENGLALAMKRLLHDASLRAQLSHEGRITIETKFHSDDHARHIASIYHEISR